MKNAISIALVLVSTTAFARPARVVTFAEFSKAAVAGAEGIGRDMPCSFNVTQTRAGLLVELNGDDGKAEMLVPPSERIKMTERAPDSDGSWDVYDVQGRGSLTIVNASDAFYRVELSTPESRAACEIDF